MTRARASSGIARRGSIVARAYVALTTMALALGFASSSRAERYRHPSECADGCLTVTAYRDHGGPSDWNCGGNTYGGHGGTDFGIYGGFAAVDEGRAVVAAAGGTVVQANDGEFDRCTTGDCAGGGGFGNYVAIQHESGLVTYYGHMRQGSIAVGVGDAVTCGQFIGFIASSGASTGPHVHFEPRGDASIDPFNGPCNGSDSLWVDQGPYGGLPSQQCEGPANSAPVGVLDAATCDGLSGWALDGDALDVSIAVHIYIDGEAGSGARGFPIVADQSRDDLCAFFGSCNHAFTFALPHYLLDGAAHAVFPYGIDTAGGNNPLLTNAGTTFTCTAPPLVDGILRHVTSPDAMAAWQFSFDDVFPYDQALIAARSTGADWSDGARLIEADNDPAIYLVDDGVKRHIVDEASLAAWHFSFDAVEHVADHDAIPFGADLPAVPTLVHGIGDPAIYVVDVPPLSPTPDPVTPPDGTGSGTNTGAGDHGDPGGAGQTKLHAGPSVASASCATGGGGVPGLVVLAVLLGRRRYSESLRSSAR